MVVFPGDSQQFCVAEDLARVVWYVVSVGEALVADVLERAFFNNEAFISATDGHATRDNQEKVLGANTSMVKNWVHQAVQLFIIGQKVSVITLGHT